MEHSKEFYLVVKTTPLSNGMSVDDNIPIQIGACETLQDASEMLAIQKIFAIQTILDEQKSGSAIVPSLSKDPFIVKVKMNEFVHFMEFPRIPFSEDNISKKTSQQLHNLMSLYDKLFSEKIKSSSVDNNYLQHLQVDPSVYGQDRRAREYELMQRLHIKPLWRGNIRDTKENQKVDNNNTSLSGSIPQPATPLSVQTSHLPTTFKGMSTPSTSAPAPIPGLLPVAHDIPNPVTTSVPLAPIPPSGTVTNSQNQTYAAPPQNTGASATSRVTGI